MGKQWKQCQILFFWAPKSLQMVIAAKKLKDAYSLEGKLDPDSLRPALSLGGQVSAWGRKAVRDRFALQGGTGDFP